MNWVLKAVTQKAISALPNPERINYILQSKVTKSLPLPKREFIWRVEHGINHFRTIQKYNPDVGTLAG